MGAVINLPARIADCVEQLSTRTTYLRVPLLNEVIQVGTGLTLPATTIAVTRTPFAVEVRRTDGKPLRAQIIRRRADNSMARTDVFTGPVDFLRLKRRPDGSKLWTLEDLPSQRDSDVLQLVETIVAFTVTKQNRAA